jgi:hypothetical protein
MYTYNGLCVVAVAASECLILPNMNDTQLERKLLHQSQVIVPHDNDVLLGRGALINKHPGNDWYRRLVISNRELYKHCQKHEKLIMAKNIVQMVHLRTPPGRFLEQSTGLWMPVSNKTAVGKTSQALRERPRKGQGVADANVAFQKMTSAHPVQEFRLLTSSEAKNALGDYSSVHLENDPSATMPQSLQPASSSAWSTHKTRNDRFLSPIEPNTTLHFSTYLKTMEEKAPPEPAACITRMTMTDDQISRNGHEDGSYKSTFARSTIDGSVEATQVLLPDDALFCHALAMEHASFMNQHEAQRYQRDGDTCDFQEPSKEMRSRAIFENPTAPRQSGVETTSTSSTSRISSQVRRSSLPRGFDGIPTFPSTFPSTYPSGSRSIDVPHNGHCRENMCYNAEPGYKRESTPLTLPPSLVQQFRSHSVTSELEPLPLPQAESLLRPSNASQETVVSSILNHLHNDTISSSAKQTMSNDKKVEGNDSGLELFLRGHTQSMESIPLKIPGVSESGTSRVLDLGSRALDLTRGGTNHTIISKRSPDEFDDLGSAHNKRDEIAARSLTRGSPTLEDLWSTLSTSDERIPHREFDCASTFCSETNSNAGSPVGAFGGMVNNAGRFTVSGGLSCSPVFDGMNRLNSHVESPRALEMNLGSNLMPPLAKTSASNGDGNHSGNSTEQEIAPRPH